MTGGKHITQVQTIAIAKRLEDVIKRLDAKHCEYIGDHTDHSIANEFQVSHHAVRGLRTNVFGLLFTRNRAEAPAFLYETQKAIEVLQSEVAGLRTIHNARIKDLISQIEDLRDRIGSLEIDGNAQSQLKLRAK
ncbi:MAG TPA: hypothetical protein VK577_20840 [Bradyrhizobium sp.]|nr:hypothetical protein [Bradyrhizobium sp.]